MKQAVNVYGGGPFLTIFERIAVSLQTKKFLQKFFFTHDLQKNGEIDVQQIRSSKNLANLFTKTLPTATFEKLVKEIGMRRLKDVVNRGSNKTL